jgi:hypothetical protein
VCSPCSILNANCFSCNSFGNCLTCIEGYNVELFNGICKCKPGYQELNKLCVIRTIGCATAIRVNNTISCYLCSQILNFKIYSINGTCICKAGYILNGDTCI